MITSSCSFQILQIFLSLALGSFYWLVACWIPKGTLCIVLFTPVLRPVLPTLSSCSPSLRSVSLMEHSKLHWVPPPEPHGNSRTDIGIPIGLMPFVSYFVRDCCAALHDIQYLGNCCFFFWFFSPDRRVNPGPIILS